MMAIYEERPTNWRARLVWDRLVDNGKAPERLWYDPKRWAWVAVIDAVEVIVK